MLSQKFVIDFGAKLLLYFITAITGIVVARIAGPEVIGTIAYGMSFVSMFGFIFGLFGTSHVKLISEGKNKQDCIKIYSTIIFLSIIVFILVVIGYYLCKKYLFNAQFTQIDQTVIFISLATISVQGLYKIAELTFVGLTQQAKVNLPKILSGILYNIGRLLVVLLGYKAIALVTTNLISSLLIIPFYFYLLGKDNFKGKWDNELFYRYIKIGFPILIITSTNSFIMYYGKIMLKDFSSMQELGYYAGGYSLAGMLLMLGRTAGTLFFPLFSKAYINNDLLYIRTQIKKFEHFLFVFIIPIILGLSIFSNTIIIFLLGDKYINSVPIFSILVFVSFFMIWGIPYSNLINGINKFKINAIFNIIYAICFIGLLNLFIRDTAFNYGAIGLAVSMLALNMIRFLGWYIYSKRKIQIKLDNNIILMLLFYLVILVFGMVFYNSYLIEFSVLIRILLFFTIIIIIYTLLYLFGFMKKNDVKFIFKIVNVKSLIIYVKEELKNKE